MTAPLSNRLPEILARLARSQWRQFPIPLTFQQILKQLELPPVLGSRPEIHLQLRPLPIRRFRDFPKILNGHQKGRLPSLFEPNLARL